MTKGGSVTSRLTIALFVLFGVHEHRERVPREGPIRRAENT